MKSFVFHQKISSILHLIFLTMSPMLYFNSSIDLYIMEPQL